MQLKQGTLLQGGKYRIENVLGQGGFGITYLAEQTVLDRKVAIKEFFMKDLCNRDADTSHVSVPSIGSQELVERFRTKFIKEAKMIAGLNNTHIVRIHDIFEENGTAYYVMEYHGGGSLADVVRRRGALPEADAIRYIREIADALDYLHQNRRNHLDVKPANILLDENDGTVLIDFGVSKRYDEEGMETSTTPVGISHGYAPIEQSKKKGVSTFSPATDIYSLGATLYKLLTGNTPPEASDVLDDGLPPFPQHISPAVCNAVEQAMQPARKDRPQTIAAFLALIGKESSLKASTVEAALIVDDSTTIDETVYGNANAIINNKKTPFTVKGVTFNMIGVEGGTFTMGATPEQGSDAYSDESPAHQVTLDSYMIGETEVTQALWTAVMGSNPSYFEGNDQRPVEQVSWEDCQSFIKELNRITGKTFRLPTESEWEYAARGGCKSTGCKYSGSHSLAKVGWYADNSDETTYPVATKAANELGIYDMSGNVWEWCSDWYDSDYYSISPRNNPTGPSSGSGRVGRGGSWGGDAGGCRVSNRIIVSPDSRYLILGLRLVLVP